jgi:hypothetical protein
MVGLRRHDRGEIEAAATLISIPNPCDFGPLSMIPGLDFLLHDEVCALREPGRTTINSRRTLTSTPAMSKQGELAFPARRIDPSRSRSSTRLRNDWMASAQRLRSCSSHSDVARELPSRSLRFVIPMVLGLCAPKIRRVKPNAMRTWCFFKMKSPLQLRRIRASTRHLTSGTSRRAEPKLAQARAWPRRRPGRRGHLGLIPEEAFSGLNPCLRPDRHRQEPY